MEIVQKVNVVVKRVIVEPLKIIVFQIEDVKKNMVFVCYV